MFSETQMRYTMHDEFFILGQSKRVKSKRKKTIMDIWHTTHSKYLYIFKVPRHWQVKSRNLLIGGCVFAINHLPGIGKVLF